jgi:putative ABC transport system substrate-binding protein
MNRRRFLLISLVGALAATLVAETQHAGEVARIGYLGSSGAANNRQREAFRQGLRDLGYVEGLNVVIEYRDDALATELVALKVDVIVTGGTLATLAAKQATTTLPIAFTSVGDPVASGFVTSLGRPGGNATGLSTLAPELVGKCLEQLKQAVPGVSRVSVFRDERTGKNLLKEAEVADVSRLTCLTATASATLEQPVGARIRAMISGTRCSFTAFHVDRAWRAQWSR